MSRATQKQVTDWCITVHNHDHYPTFNTNKMKYMIVGKEFGEEKKTPHFQVFAIWKRSVRISGAKKDIEQKEAHFEERMGTREQARDYCKKENDWQEFGEWPGDSGNQGRRTDLEDFAGQIKAGKSVEDLLMESNNNVRVYSRAYRTFDRLEDIINRRAKKTWMTRVVWITGETGTGKSKTVYDIIKRRPYYRKIMGDAETKWWDGYTGEYDVWFDDYGGEIPYKFLMQLADIYPMSVPRRGREPRPWMAKTIWITSVKTPEETYRRQNETVEGLSELNRRMTHYVKRAGIPLEIASYASQYEDPHADSDAEEVEEMDE